MLEADLVISAAGQTLYELAATGCPTIAVAVVNNPKGQLQALAEAGTVISTGSACGEGAFVTTISNVLDTLLLDADARSAMAVAGQNLVDGSGGQQVAEAIQSAIG